MARLLQERGISAAGVQPHRRLCYSFFMRVLGIDPGSNFLGLGCVEARGRELVWVGHTVVKVSAKNSSLESRLRAIHGGVQQALDLWQPQAVAAEEVFFAKNPQSALKLGQARGAALLGGALRGLAIHEYSATLVKQTITGSGRAEKNQVQRMIRVLLGDPSRIRLEFEREDASDALAVAICHLQHRHKQAILQPRDRALVPAAKRLGPGPA